MPVDRDGHRWPLPSTERLQPLVLIGLMTRLATDDGIPAGEVDQDGEGAVIDMPSPEKDRPSAPASRPGHRHEHTPAAMELQQWR
jgi:hypothetical protein